MFSSLYYLSQLIESDLIFSDIDKIQIFKFAEKNPDKINELIKIFEDEQKGIEYIRKNYKEKLGDIGEKLADDLLKRKTELEEKEKKKFKDKLIKMKILEKQEKEKEEKRLDLLFNN